MQHRASAADILGVHHNQQFPCQNEEHLWGFIHQYQSIAGRQHQRTKTGKHNGAVCDLEIQGLVKDGNGGAWINTSTESIGSKTGLMSEVYGRRASAKVGQST